jgi:UDP-3-O-[3-hydroxymyristoyl] glucosamine N-acyltransferase
MSEPRFFPVPEALTLAEIAASTGAELRGDPERRIRGVAPLERAGPADLAFLDNPAYVGAFAASTAGGCLVAPKFADQAPPGLSILVCADPYRAFAQVAARLYPAAMMPAPIFEGRGIAPGAAVHPTARLEPGVAVDPGAVVGPRAEIGGGTVVGAGAVIGPEVRIGRDCAIGAGASIVHALIGDRVIIHPGARIGQDGFGFALGREGHLKMPQVGRVIVQDRVEVGANTTIDRGANRDTIVGEGSKIDNLVQIAHNVVIGRHCVIVAQTGISGSATLEDFVVLGGHVGVVGHVRIGAGAQIAGSSNVREDVPPGARWGGTPARPMRAWFREMAVLRRLAQQRGGGEPK